MEPGHEVEGNVIDDVTRSKIVLDELMPIEVPRNGLGMTTFTGEEQARIDELTQAALAENRWQHNCEVPVDLADLGFWSYWLYKSENPIEKAELGSGVESYLERFRSPSFNLRPEGFEEEGFSTLSASGDLMCTKGLENAKDHLYEWVYEDIFGADIAYANLESTLTEGTPEALSINAGSSPTINLQETEYRTLVGHRGRNFDVLQLANNHILDCGEAGIQATLRALDADGIEQVGINESAELATNARVIEVAGLKVGWVAHTYCVNFKAFPPGKPWRVNMTPFYLQENPDVSLIETQLRACREAGCDLVVVALHWGLEFEFYPRRHQLKWAHHFADMGADLVIGHHPHVAQPVEIYSPRQSPERKVPILYSLGNLTSVFSHPASVLSLVARIRISRGELAGEEKTVITGLELVPVAIVQALESLRLVPVRFLADGHWAGDFDEYVKEICRYTTLLLGDEWRRPPSDRSVWP